MRLFKSLHVVALLARVEPERPRYFRLPCAIACNVPILAIAPEACSLRASLPSCSGCGRSNPHLTNLSANSMHHLSSSSVSAKSGLSSCDHPTIASAAGLHLALHWRCGTVQVRLSSCRAQAEDH